MKAFLLFSHIALRNVRRNARRSLFTIIAIAFGLLCLIVFQALKVGLHREMVISTVQLDAGTLQVHAAGYEMNLASIKKIPEPEKVIEAFGAIGEKHFSQRIKSSALLLAGKKSSSVVLSGIDPEEEPRVTFLSGRIVRGRYVNDEGGILIGDVLAKGIGVEIGDGVTLTAQDRQGLPVTRRFPVAGIYTTALSSFDRTHVFMHLADAQEFLHAEDIITEIAVRTDSQHENNAAEKLRAVLSDKDYQVRTWKEIAPDVQQIIDLNDATMQLLILIVFAIIAMGITNTMTMVIFERFRELGILSAIGTAPSGILTMVVMESFFLGAIASLVGSIAALAACAYLGKYGIDLTSFTSSNQYFATSHVLKAHLLLKDLVIANVVTLATALIGGIYPAWKASRLKPVDAISHT
ncbi:MAG: ABC transporter permease [Nitrospirae bacterium]|nr:ABC transporter permease [Nitrospirota bacterium]